MEPEYSVGYGKFCKREYKAKIKALESNRDHLWIASVDMLIPKASRLAHVRVKQGGAAYDMPGADGNIYQADSFTKYFHEEMDRMKREAGLIA